MNAASIYTGVLGLEARDYVAYIYERVLRILSRTLLARDYLKHLSPHLVSLLYPPPSSTAHSASHSASNTTSSSPVPPSQHAASTTTTTFLGATATSTTATPANGASSSTTTAMQHVTLLHLLVVGALSPPAQRVHWLLPAVDKAGQAAPHSHNKPLSSHNHGGAGAHANSRSLVPPGDDDHDDLDDDDMDDDMDDKDDSVALDFAVCCMDVLSALNEGLQGHFAEVTIHRVSCVLHWG